MVSLVKGQKVDLTKGNAGLKQIIVGLGWDANKYDGDNFDLDAAAFLLGADGKVRNSDDFVYYNIQAVQFSMWEITSLVQVTEMTSRLLLI